MAEHRPSSGETSAPRLIAFEDYRFDPATGELWQGDREIKLTPRAASLLIVLAEHATQIVTKQELIKRVWDGKAVGDDALTSCVQDLRRALGDDSRRPRFIETRHRRGYRMLVPATPLAINESATEKTQPLTLPDRPSIAVLRFQNMSDDEGQQYFVDGVVDDIITALSRFGTLFVISRNSSFAYSGRAVDVKQVGRELGVRYVLAGSVRKASNRLRVTAQLVDATTGSHMWGDRLEGALEAVFDFQDQITEKVVATIAPKLLEAEIVRVGRKPAGNLDAYDCHLRGFALVYPATKDGIVEALSLFRRAIELDPNYSAPYGAAILTYGIRRGHGWAEDPEKDKAEVTRLLQSAVRVGREDALVLGETAWAAAYVLQDLPFARNLMDQALDLNVNLARIWGCSGWINLWIGDLDRSVDDFRRALRLDPLTTVYTRNLRDAMAHAYFFLGKYDEAISLVERELRGNPNSHGALRIGAASAAYAGNSEVAQRLGKHLQSIDPAFRVSRLKLYLGPYQKREFVAKYADGLRRAGLPE